MIDYNSLNGKLISAGTGVWASESHGFLCGVFCAGNTVASSIWQEYLLAGVASCVAVTFMTGATTNKVAIEHLRIKLEGELDLAGFLGLKTQFHPGFDQLNNLN